MRHRFIIRLLLLFLLILWAKDVTATECSVLDIDIEHPNDELYIVSPSCSLLATFPSESFTPAPSRVNNNRTELSYGSVFYLSPEGFYGTATSEVFNISDSYNNQVLYSIYYLCIMLI